MPSSPSCSTSRPHVVPGGVDHRFTPDADPEPARRALHLTTPVRALRRVARPRARTSPRWSRPRGRWPRHGVEIVVAGGHRPQFAREHDLRRPAAGSAASTTRCSPACTPARRRSRSRPSTRASACRSWRRWRAARRWSPRRPHGAPGDLRGRRRARGAPGRAFGGSADASCWRRRGARAAARAAGLRRASGFTWERTARQIDALIAARRSAGVAERLAAAFEPLGDALERRQRRRR